MLMRTMLSRLLAAVTVVLVLGSAGCAARQVRNSAETLRIGKAGVVVLADSSVRVGVSGAPDSVSLPENTMLALDMFESAKRSLAAKGYIVSDASRLMVGAQLPAAEPVRVRTPAGTFASPGSYGKPFIVRPDAVDAEKAAKLNELYLWAGKATGRAPSAALSAVNAPGAVLISCLGGNRNPLPAGADAGVSIASFRPAAEPSADAWSEITLVVLDSATGAVSWVERGSLSSFTPEAAAREVERLIRELPAAK